MTKYQIAYKETSFIFDEHELDITGLSNAMEIYAKQVAIEFINYIAKEGVELYHTPNGAAFMEPEEVGYSDANTLFSKFKNQQP